jgi:hypothetical protein
LNEAVTGRPTRSDNERSTSRANLRWSVSAVTRSPTSTVATSAAKSASRVLRNHSNAAGGMVC